MKCLAFLLALAPFTPALASVEDAVQTLTAVAREGAGNEKAGAAWRTLVAAGPSALPAVLAASGRGGPVADNWLRVAGDAIVDAALGAGQPLPLGTLEKFLRDTTQPAPGRQLAFDLIASADPARAQKIEPTLLADPVQELRRGAVGRMIDDAKALEDFPRLYAYLRALEAVRDEDQTRLIADELKKLGMSVDLPEHFGFLMDWKVIGPFDNTDRKGFDTAFPPEKTIDLGATYAGKSGEIGWKEFQSDDDYGKVDLNKPIGMLKEATAYAFTTFDSPVARDAELRLGSKNAWKVWLNGELLFGRDEYHRGQQMDQYKLKCRLEKGANTVLVKVCQNEQKEDWTVEWEFQIRVCDRTGTAILSPLLSSK